MNLLKSFIPLILATATLHGYELVVRAPSGEPFVVGIESGESFLAVIDRLQGLLGTTNEYYLDFKTAAYPSKKAKSAKAQPIRNYYTPVSASEKKDVSYVINTLGMSSLLTIATSQSDLKEAGDRIDHLHPLRFLLCIFTDNQMKTSMEAMKNRSWVWGEFINGLKGTFEYEMSQNNVKSEHIYDFASQVGIKPDLIIPAINRHQWKQLVLILINNVPKQPNGHD